MIIESGVIVALGIIFTFMKLPWRHRIKALSNPIACDLIVFVGLNVLHWGSFYGIMAAACGAMITSALLSVGRWMFGYIEQPRNLYHPGVFNIADKLRQEYLQ